MSPQRLKLGFLAFSGLSAALAANMLLLQPGTSRPGASERQASGAGDRRAAPRTAKMLSVAVGAEPAATSADAIAAKLAEGGEAAARADADATPGSESAETIRSVQRELQARGYDAGTADGVPGLITRAAVLAYEYDHGLQMTAEPSDRLLRQIKTGAGQPGARPPQIAQGERSVHAEQVIRTVQQSLANVGYSTGKIDGKLGEETVRAIREFEIDQGLPETGRVSGQLVARLARLAGQGRLSSAAR